jgi:serine/threonine protein kinase
MGQSASDLCGQVLAGKYRVDRVLGAGGMGVVVEAHHLALDSKIAIKFLTPEVQGNAEAVARFAREARVAAKIRSEHVTRVLDVGMLDTGAHYIVMELLDGMDLRQWLTRKGPLPVGEAVDFVLQASEAIAEAHDLGIVHRDLKPANLFCVRRPNGSQCIKVLDFGISKMSSLGDSGGGLSMTGTATVMGTPFYMSPEQMDSARNTDGRTDIWALGVILFELLTGQLPFSGESLPQVCMSVTSRPAPSVRALRADVPPELEAAIHKCLEKDRTKRFQTVGDLCDAVAPFAAVLDSRSARGRPEGSTLMASPTAFDEAGLSQAPDMESIRGFGKTARGVPGRNLRVAVAMAVGAIATLGLISALLITGTPGPRSAASPGVDPLPSLGTASSSPPAVTKPVATAAPATGEPSQPATTVAEELPPAPAPPASATTPRQEPKAPRAHDVVPVAGNSKAGPGAPPRPPSQRPVGPGAAPAAPVPAATAAPTPYDERL